MPITYRPAGLADSRAVFEIFQRSILDLGQRLNVMAVTGGQDEAVLAGLWEERRSLYEHLARTAEHFWLAEADGQPVGFARSIRRDGVRELTEFFVLPGQQSAGVGRELLERAFPAEGVRHRLINATTDQRAQARYLKAGVYPRFPVYYFARAPEAAGGPGDLEVEPLAAGAEALAVLRAIDGAVLGHTRDADHAWLLTDRAGFLYRRGGRPVGYGYVGFRSGPFALLETRDFPAVLTQAETEAARQGHERFGVEVPMLNRAAVGHLLRRGFEFDAFFTLLMTDAPFGQFENYLLTSPPFFL
ncbi:MAG: GNAT family N-acetyltransferase [Anaerolineales bacterium]|nr:GNAT family N-acetyltransferase [Anaerolineales bacterium]